VDHRLDLLRRVGALLKNHHQIIGSEVIFDYPKIGEYYPFSWRKQLQPLSLNSLWQIFGEGDLSSIEGSELATSISAWSAIDQDLCSTFDCNQFDLSTNNFSDYPKDALVGVGEKKLHELTHLAPLIESVARCGDGERGALTVLDIGGGAGYLARLLTHCHGLSVTSYDRDERLQHKGAKQIERHLRNRSGCSCQLKWQSGEWGGDSCDGREEELLSDKTLLVGLHACGNLSAQLIEDGAQSCVPAIISLGCCYARFDGEGRHYLSKAGQSLEESERIEWNSFHLTLASRAHQAANYQSFKRTLHVKSYRYKLHLMLYHLLAVTDFIPVGEVRSTNYNNGFSQYALGRLEYLKIEHSLTATEIEQFGSQEWVESEVSELILCDLIRWQLGRMTEIFLLMDRAIYLEEQGYRVGMMPLFDPRISPRNLAIVAQLNS
jgi:hypothetical protein